MIIKNNIIPFKGFTAMAIWPFIFVRKDWLLRINTLANDLGNLEYKETINHEKIHFRQQIEVTIAIFIALIVFTGITWVLSLSIFGFYIIYLINWVIELVKILFGGDRKAYSDIIFEREAKENQSNFLYLSNRRHFAFIKYISNGTK